MERARVTLGVTRWGYPAWTPTRIAVPFVLAACLLRGVSRQRRAMKSQTSAGGGARFMAVTPLPRCRAPATISQAPRLIQTTCARL